MQAMEILFKDQNHQTNIFTTVSQGQDHHTIQHTENLPEVNHQYTT